MANTPKKILVTNDYENYRIDRFLIQFLSLPKNLIHKELRKNRGLADITSDYSKNKPEVQLAIDENKAKDLGLSIQAIGKSIETLLDDIAR